MNKTLLGFSFVATALVFLLAAPGPSFAEDTSAIEMSPRAPAEAVPSMTPMTLPEEKSKPAAKSVAKPAAKSSAKSAVKAGSKKATSAASLLKEVSKKYRSEKVAKIATTKKVTSELLGKTTNYEGTIYLSQGKFRWENDTPEQSLLLFDGSTIFNVQYPPKDLGGPVQVAKAKLDKNTKSQVLITTLLGTQPIEKNFKIIKDSTVGNTTSIELKPIAGDLRVKELTLDLDSKAKLIRKISYKDDVNNLTVIELTKTDFIPNNNKELFKFKIPKDAQVTNL